MASGDLELKQFAMVRGGQRLLESTDLTVERGARVLVTGASGCGKSTLLRRLCALEAGAEEHVLYSNRLISHWNIRQFRQCVAYVPQHPVMVEGTVRDNLLLPMRLRAVRNGAPDDAEMRAGLKDLELNVSLDAEAQSLSPGQKARISLLRRLMYRPEVLLCDEPIAALDPGSAEAVMALLLEYNRQGTTLIVVSHQPLPKESFRQIRFEERRLREVG